MVGYARPVERNIVVQRTVRNYVNFLGRCPVLFQKLLPRELGVDNDPLKMPEERSSPEVLQKTLHPAAMRSGIVDGQHQRRYLA